MDRLKRILITFGIIGIPVLFVIFGKLGTMHYNSLPIYGERELSNNGQGPDTIYHTVPNFNFTSQTGKQITPLTFEGTVYVASFFFTTCPDICPNMNAQLSRVYEKYKGNPKVKFLSHTVDPNRDSVEVLAQYAKSLDVDNEKWLFVTGNKDSIYNIAMRGYMVTVSEGDAKPISFLHTEKLILVDMDKRIRGFYEGTETNDVNKLIDDIQMLLKEYSDKKM